MPLKQYNQLARLDLDMEELARRLGVSEFELGDIEISYQEFTIPKRGGGSRQITAPNPELKKMQRLKLQDEAEEHLVLQMLCFVVCATLLR